MKNIIHLFFGLAVSTGSVLGQIVTCDGNQAPDWDACIQIYNNFRSSIENPGNFFPLCALLEAPDVDPNTLNCRIAWCPNGPEVSESYSGLDGFFDLIRMNCDPAGGGSGTDGYELQVTNNPDFEPAEKKMARSTMRFARRQAENDDGFTLVTSSQSIERDGIQITGRLPSGSMYMISETDSQSTSVSVSVEVGASFFDFFSASVGTTVTEEQSTSNTVGISINIDCEPGQSGQVFWYPLYTVYSGFTTPSNTNVDVVVPQDDAASGTNYRVTCLE